jgi:hypothetical protein
MNPAREIQTLVAKFVDEMTVLAKGEALRHASLALAVSEAKAPSAASRSRDGKRSASELAGLKERVLEHIAAHPGVRIEQINASLGTATKELALPLRQLVDARVLRTEGQRRGTKYYPGGKAKKLRESSRRKARA